MSEHADQCALFEWAEWNASRLPELDLLFAIPNGGARHPAVAAKLKAEGVKAGIPDICLPIARQGKHSLYIELKHGKNRTTDMQERWLHGLREQGMACHVCYGWTEAAMVIVTYLDGNPSDFGL